MVLDGDTIQKDGTFCILDGEGKLKIAKFKGAYQESAAGKTVTQIMYHEHKPVSVLSCLPNAKDPKVAHDVQQINSTEHPLLQLFSPEGVHKLLRKVSDVASAVKEEVRLSHLFSKH